MIDDELLVVRITGMASEFRVGDLVPVFDEVPVADDEQLIETEADFDIHHLAAQLRAWTRRGRSEDEFRTILREHWPSYADVAFPDRKAWLYTEEAEALIELGVAEPVTLDTIDDNTFSAWLD